MNSVFARVLVVSTLVALPVCARASTKVETPTSKPKHEAKGDKPKHGQAHASLGKKDHPPKKAKHHAHKPKDEKGIAAAPSAAKAP